MYGNMLVESVRKLQKLVPTEFCRQGIAISDSYEIYDTLLVYGKQTKSVIGQPSDIFRRFSDPTLWTTLSSGGDKMARLERGMQYLIDAISGGQKSTTYLRAVFHPEANVGALVEILKACNEAAADRYIDCLILDNRIWQLED